MDVCSSAVTFMSNRMNRFRKRGSNSISCQAALMLVSLSLSPAYSYLECYANIVCYKLHSLFVHKGETISLPRLNQFRKVQHIGVFFPLNACKMIFVYYIQR